MIVSFSKNPIRQIIGVAYWNIWTLLFFTLCSVVAYVVCIEYDNKFFVLPPVQISILGSALAIFLGFRNSSAYDRWWEARKVWGAVVNNSRSLGMELITYPVGVTKEDEKQIDEWRRIAIKRHIGWVYALNGHLRKNKVDLKEYLPLDDIRAIEGKQNLPAQILVIQGNAMRTAYTKGWIEEYTFNALIGTLKKLYDDQGKAERIKNTIFPFYYNYFTMLILWLFTIILPFAMAGIMNNWMMIPISVMISFSFFILNKSGLITENPFEGRASDTPVTSICRTIEIDLLQMLNTDEKDTPDPLSPITGRFGVKFQQ